MRCGYFQKFDHEYPSSRSQVRSKVQVTQLAQHSIDAFPFNSMSLGPSIPEIWQFQNLTLKIQGQGYRSKPHSGSNILLIHIPFVPCQLTLPFVRYGCFKIWPWKSKVIVRSKVQVTHLAQHPIDALLFVPCQWAHPFLRYGYYMLTEYCTFVSVMFCFTRKNSTHLHTLSNINSNTNALLLCLFWTNLSIKLTLTGHKLAGIDVLGMSWIHHFAFRHMSTWRPQHPQTVVPSITFPLAGWSARLLCNGNMIKLEWSILLKGSQCKLS